MPRDDLLSVLHRAEGDVRLQRGGALELTELEQEQRGGPLPLAAHQRGGHVPLAAVQLGGAEVVAPSAAALGRSQSWPMWVGRSVEAPQPAESSDRFRELDFYPGGTTPDWVHCQSAETSRTAEATADE
jgi:hypothetical protein